MYVCVCVCVHVCVYVCVYVCVCVFLYMPTAYHFLARLREDSIHTNEQGRAIVCSCYVREVGDKDGGRCYVET